MNEDEKPVLNPFRKLNTFEKLCTMEILAEQILEEMPTYSLAAQILVHVRILRNLNEKNMPEQIASFKKRGK